MTNRPTEETFHYFHSWLKSIFDNQGKFSIDSVIISSILGSSWTSPWDVWTAYQTGIPSLTISKIWEKRVEWLPMLRNIYENKTHRSLDIGWRRVYHGEHEWCSASVLGICHDEIEQTDGCVLFTWSNISDDWPIDGTSIRKWTRVLPPDIAMEAYWTLFCSNLPWIDIIVGLPDANEVIEVRIIRIYKDENLQNNLYTASKNWRTTYLLQRQIPAIDGSRSCTSFLMERFAYGTNFTRKANDKEDKIITEYADLLQQMRELEAKQQLLQNQLIKQIGDFGGIEASNGNSVVVSRKNQSLHLNYTSPKTLPFAQKPTSKKKAS